MARAIWSGSISFGLINIPVKLYSAITERTVRFNQIDTTNGARIRTKKVNAETEEDVDPDDIAKGYEIRRGEYVLVSDDELATLQPRATHTIDLDEFVDLDEIDPIFFHGAYYVAPDERAAKSYVLLVEAMQQANKVAVARFVMRSKQYVAAMRPRDGRLTLSMMVYEDEINEVGQIPEFEDLENVEITDRELAMAEQLIESLSAEFEPERFQDTYREELLELIESKDAGRELVMAAPESPSDDKVIDLMAALEASVKAAKGARGRHPTSLAVADDAEETDEVDAAPTKRRTAGSTRKAATTKKAAAGRKSTSRKAPAAKKASAKKAPTKKAAAKKAPAAKKAVAASRSASPAARKSA